MATTDEPRRPLRSSDSRAVLATEEDLARVFGPYNLLLSEPVEPDDAAPVEEEPAPKRS